MTYQFGSGIGHLSKRVGKAAQKHGAKLINQTHRGCQCGSPECVYPCPQSRTHVFVCRDQGRERNEQIKRLVLAEVASVGTAKDLQVIAG